MAVAALGPQPIRLADYQPPCILIEQVELLVQLFPDHALVDSQLTVRRNGLSPTEILQLQAVDLELLGLWIDGLPLPDSEWKLDDGLLSLSPKNLPQAGFRLRSISRLRPSANSSLEGLYASRDLFTTQCEAEGFRRITPFLDRPDVLSRYRVRIEAGRDWAPTLLSNGNCLAKGELAGGRHYAEWEDPFPKPCYLFALVAGPLVEVVDQFRTSSGRQVRLRIHVESEDQQLCAHAMASLKRSMAWDEKVYGLEYDLDEYNIVAVRHFNMGAMENKGLNIFNSKLVLADAESSTDAELERVESVIAHEYFHNWTGNRVTCRDWFQLSLKEGLTVFRDQEFSADLHCSALKRIEDVAMLRAHQFPEDRGPTAHPVQPDQYIAIDNFYTTTIYEKGAELIRMQRTLLGEEKFMAGVDLYLKRHDGEAATCEQFLQALEAASGKSLTLFRRWYKQSGTPRLNVKQQWDSTLGLWQLELSQSYQQNENHKSTEPVPIPVALALFGATGELLQERLLVLDQAKTTWQFADLPPAETPPLLSILRGFSAPVILEFERTDQELVQLLLHESDPYSRWDSAQQLWQRCLLQPTPERQAAMLAISKSLISSEELKNPRLLVALLQSPATEELEAACLEQGFAPDPPALESALLQRRVWLGKALAFELRQLCDRLGPVVLQPWPQGVGERQLLGMAWSWLFASNHQEGDLPFAHWVDGPSMDLARSALFALQPWDCQERTWAMEAFQARWQERPVILDNWFALEASTPFGDPIARAEALLEHPRFDYQAPNSLRAVLGGFARCAQSFHRPDGSGYRWLAKQIVALDQRNPIAASRFLKLFMAWQNYAPQRREQMVESLNWMLQRLNSANSQEVVRQCLGV
jgi:aminopeptidase N